MAGLVKKFLASASVVAGMSAVFGAPAIAVPEIDTVELNGPSLIYDYTTNGTGDLVEILQDANNGNIELNGTGDHSSSVEADNFTELEVSFDDGSNVVLRSLDIYDWFFNADFAEQDELAWQWFNDAWDNSDSGLKDYLEENLSQDSVDFDAGWSYFSNAFLYEEAFNPEHQATFEILFGNKLTNEGVSLARRISDPNVASVSKDDEGNIFIQLAGHNNHSSGLAFSEVIAIEVDGVFGYAYQIGGPDELATAFDSDDEGSHEGLYNFKIAADWEGGILSEPEDIPEPSTVLGLMAISGLVAASKRKSAK